MKRQKTPLEIIINERKAEIQKLRISLARETDKDFALNHALIGIVNPSPEALLWTLHYLRKLNEA